MKTTRTTKVVLIAVVCITLFGWLASEFTSPRKTRAGRINTVHNYVTVVADLPKSITNASPATTPEGKK
jgi:hypothetical protein